MQSSVLYYSNMYVGDQTIDGMNTDDDEGPDDLLGPADFEETDYCMGGEGPDYYDEEE